MKKWIRYIAILMASLLLMGCGKNAAQTVETVLDVAEVILDAASEEDEEPIAELDDWEEEETQYDAEEEDEDLPEALTEDELKEEVPERIAESSEQELLDENGSYNSKEDVALYIYQYGKLPSNYLTKKEAEALGWSGGSLEPYAKGKSIGGSRFGNYEKILPTKKGRTYTECDIDTKGKKSRGAKRIVFSNDGLIYYTDDHYATFELLYGEE